MCYQTKGEQYLIFTKKKNKTKQNKDHDYIPQTESTPNPFKCAVHPLLQFSEVCQREIAKTVYKMTVERTNHCVCLY